MEAPHNIVLTGFMGTGKSTIAPLLARNLGYGLVDTDALISQRQGRTVEQIFQDDGEEVFRHLELELVRELASRQHCVIATGGGTLLTPEARSVLEACGPVVCLTARAEVIAQRLEGKPNLPLLPLENRAEAISALLERRAFLYRSLQHYCDTSDLDPPAAAREIMAICKIEAPSVAYSVQNTAYPIVVRKGLLSDHEAWRAQIGEARRVLIITDQNVAPLYARPLSNQLQQLGYDVPVISFPAGEHYKTLQTLSELLNEMAGLRIDRKTLVLAVGGGVVGDVAGLAAALYMRGLRLIQVPTSLLAMVDASIGGKTAIDLAGIKNLVGSFYQPESVLIDVSALRTLPVQELSSGMAELIKSALIADAELFEQLEQQAQRVLELDLEVTEGLVRRCARIKSEIVSQDPGEGGRRKVLNLGHTLGHAFEADAGMVLLTHGQAVGLGMLCAAWIGKRLGITAGGLQARLRNLLLKAGLPVTHNVARPDRLLDFVRMDKKGSSGNTSMVIPVRPGEVVIQNGIEDRMLLDSLEAITV